MKNMLYVYGLWTPGLWHSETRLVALHRMLCLAGLTLELLPGRTFLVTVHRMPYLVGLTLGL